ncbi:MAG: hypothetical protein Q4G00_10470 [Clostridia bacterium]|nr:hypothetical protein [Clostridia bacterium]
MKIFLFTGKKTVAIVCFLLALFCMVSMPLISLAEEETTIDLSAMTIEKLTELTTKIDQLTVESLWQLKTSVEDQLIKMGVSGYVYLPSGNYLVGRDIAPGKYIITSHNLDNGYAYITVYNVGETEESYDYAYRETNILAYEYEQALKEGKEMERPAILDTGRYISMDDVRLSDSGNAVQVTLIEGQTLKVKISGNLALTIEKTEGLFME